MVRVSVFVSLLLIFNFSPQINHFYYFTSLHGLQDVENHCVHLRDIELQTGRKIPHLRFPHVLFSIWRAWNYKTEQKNICFESRKKDTKTSTKRHEWHKDMNDTKWTIWYFQQCACVSVIYFAPVVTTTHRTRTTGAQQRVWALKWMSLVKRVRNC